MWLEANSKFDHMHYLHVLFSIMSEFKYQLCKEYVIVRKDKIIYLNNKYITTHALKQQRMPMLFRSHNKTTKEISYKIKQTDIT